MARSKKPVKNENKFQAAVDYLAEYTGVKGAAIADSEGLVVARSGQGEFDAELHCAIALEIVTTLDSTLAKLMDPGIEHLSLKTAGNWLTVARSKPFCLVIAADKKATDLLNIRIGRALDMISSLKNKYPQAFSAGPSGVKAKNMEAVHV